MDIISILIPSGVMAGLGLVFGALLGVASKKFAVEVDERVEAVRALLPGANCGGCGCASCDAFASEIVHHGMEPTDCAVNSAANTKAIGAYLGRNVAAKVDVKAVVVCQGTVTNSPPRYEYEGIETCRDAALLAGGNRGCSYACLGNGDCARACAFDAITIRHDGVPHIDFNQCTGCGACTRVCPRHVIERLPHSAVVAVLCRTKERGRTVRDACKVGCITCRLCERACPTEAISCETGVAVIDYDKCVSCMACMERCPNGTIQHPFTLR